MTTDGGPVEVLGRFRGVVGALPPRFFNGAVGEGFSEWIGGRWGLGGGRPPSPARRIFRKEKGHLPPPRRPAGRAARFSNYRLYATLRMTLNLLPVVSSARTGAAESAFVPVPASLPGARGRVGGGAISGHLTRESWAGFRLLSERLRETARLSSREQTLRILFGGGGDGAGVRTHMPGSAGRSKGGEALVHSSFATGPLNFFPGATWRWTQLFREGLKSTLLRRDEGGIKVVPGAGMVISLRRFPQGSGTAWHTLLLRDSVRHSRAGEPGAREQLTTLLHTALRGAPGQALTTRSSTTTALRLTFAAPRPSDARAEAQGAARTAPALSLQFARQVGASARGVADALRELRQTLGDVRTPAPAPSPPVEHLTRQVLDQLERELRIEKERRGL